MAKKRYALVGTGNRAGLFIRSICNDFADVAELVAICDTNPGRLEYYNGFFMHEVCHDHPGCAAYAAQDFDRMISETHPDVVIITTPDYTHHLYGCRAMELGCDVISEKPMTVDAAKCQEIIDTQKRTGRNYRVTFNYRYNPRNTKVKEIIRSGEIGEISSVNFEWLLDTSHGADYFRRWHREKNNSGGLLVHKSTHHFDLVNWWMDTVPEMVFAQGALRFYGRKNAVRRGVTQFYDRARDNEIARHDPFALHVPAESQNQMLYYDTEKYDHYYRDRSVFDENITIEDNMGVLVHYRNGVFMNYTLCAHCPWEGYRVAFNGTAGRLEVLAVEKGFTSPGEDLSVFGMRDDVPSGEALDRKGMVPELIVQRFWQKPEVRTYTTSPGGHGGGDPKLLRDLLVGAGDDPLGHAADFHDGAASILTGIAANISLAEKRPVWIKDLVHF